MSDEKPNFKVKDRRLFNSDGTLREGVEREEERPAPPADAPEAREGGRAAATASGATDAGEVADDEARGVGRAHDGEAAGPREEAGEPGASDMAGDPTPFANLVMFIASPAAAAMGMTEHPGLAPGELDLPLARHCIDLLATVREKSRGNLSQQEQQIVDGLLAELRMQYVSLTSAPRPAPPRGFSGGDITGGR
jgi:Domain of unknown function (DUF1844)